MTSPHEFQPGAEYADQLDAADPLASYREQFHLPLHENGAPVLYFCGNSLGLQPKGVAAALEQELEDWKNLAVNAHFRGKHPWYPYHENFREVGARLVGANSGEVVLMNTLTVNLHLLMVSFYRPSGPRRKILIEHAAFPSDLYAVQSQLQFHGCDPQEDLLIAKPREGESTLRTEDLIALIEEHGSEIALVMMGGVNYFSGQLFNMKEITAAAHAQGCAVGFDLAHAAGNVPLQLHDWNVDFAVWCSYKYLNGGPGAIAGGFVHERHGSRDDLPRFAGWWGNDPEQRFRMHLLDRFDPSPGAEGWQLSNPPIFSMTPLLQSLALFDEATMPKLRQKSLQLTGYLEYLLDGIPGDRYEVLTPRDPEQRGCQLSVRIKDASPDWIDRFDTRGVVCDYRPPDVIRVAPVPLYNRFRDVYDFCEVLREDTAS